MNKDWRWRCHHPQKPKKGIRSEGNQSLPRQQQLNIDLPAREHPKSNGFDPNQKTAKSEVGLPVFNKEKQQEEEVRQSGKSKDDELDDIRSRLEEMKLVAQEPDELSEEQLRVNDRLQEEEILAMEAIYGENVIVLDREDGLRSFQINIHIDVPDKLVMYTKINSFGEEVEFGRIGSKAMATTSKEFFHSFEVQYLPPIVLTCLLPKAYPSHLAPFFTISVQWLDAMRISSLCQMLDMIWTGQSGQGIVYPWVDWLQNSSLSYYELDNKIPLPSFGKADDAGDRRAISESVSPDVDIPSILNYNDDQCNEKFCQNSHECCICLSEYPGTKFVRLPCKHFFCRSCMETYSTMYAKEGVAVSCPQIKCKEPVPLGLVKSLLRDEEFEHWESLLFYKALDTMSDLVFCPRCEMACLEDEDHLAQCPKCFFTFCGLCRDRFHVGVQCMTSEEKLQFLQDRQPETKTQLLSKQQRKELDMINELFSMEEIKRTAKRCPKCFMGITRTSGCNHMSCTRCEEHFCYKCGKAYETGKPLCCSYFDADHESVRQERLERKAERQRQARRREGLEKRFDMLSQQQRQALNKMRAEDPANHVHPCPHCRQMNAKVENNNHIFCWACQKHYCYLCRDSVKRSSEHYGPKGCKQHSAG